MGAGETGHGVGEGLGEDVRASARGMCGALGAWGMGHEQRAPDS